MKQTNLETDDRSADPWYRFGMVWMIIALPLIVVVASLITVSIAFKNAPIVIDRTNYESVISEAVE